MKIGRLVSVLPAVLYSRREVYLMEQSPERLPETSVIGTFLASIMRCRQETSITITLVIE